MSAFAPFRSAHRVAGGSHPPRVSYHVDFRAARLLPSDLISAVNEVTVIKDCWIPAGYSLWPPCSC